MKIPVSLQKLRLERGFFPSSPEEGKNFNLHWNTLADWYFLFIFQGFLKIPIWWFKPSSHMKHGENGLDQVNGLACRMDDLQVSPAGGELDQFSKGVVCDNNEGFWSKI